MAYFLDFRDALDGAEVEMAPGAHVADPGTDLLPFDLLDDRRFEILAYRLKCAQYPKGARVTLMQGVGERGRDVIVYSQNGAVIEIIQCKNLRDKMTAPAVRGELLKVALHAFVEPAILGRGPVRYELWCPGGLTEPAAQIFDRWPQHWTEPRLREDFDEIVSKFKKLSHLKWEAVQDFVTTTFVSIIQPERLENIHLAEKVRACRPVYRSYFQTISVAEVGEIQDALRKVLSEAGFRELSDKDAKHVLDRIAAFPPEKRLVVPSGYVMGLPQELLAGLDAAEFRQFAELMGQATHDLTKLALSACARMAQETTRKFREEVRPQTPSLASVFNKALTMGVIVRVMGMMHLGLKEQPGTAAYKQMGLRDRLAHHAVETWNEYQRCIAAYDPQRHPFASDEEFRNRIALHGLGGATTEEEFKRALKAAVDQHYRELEARFEEFMKLVPESILVIADTQSAFQNEWLMGRMAESLTLLEKLRVGNS
jgi:hypothetical protein